MRKLLPRERVENVMGHLNLLKDQVRSVLTEPHDPTREDLESLQSALNTATRFIEQELRGLLISVE